MFWHANKAARMMRLAAIAFAIVLPCRVFALDEAGWREALQWSGAEPQAVFANGEAILIFTNTAQTTALTINGTAKARVLAVGGGGSGGIQTGTNAGAGGGGGGVVEATSWTFYSNVWTIAVGAGGALEGTTNSDGANGGDTTISTNGVTVFKALGGGGGGRNKDPGADGGSGGGAAAALAGAALQSEEGLPEAGVAHYGNVGGTIGEFSYAAGGGGGAGGAGGDATEKFQGGAGGDGIASDITGTLLYYGAGGGGSSRASGTSGGYTPGAGGKSGDGTGDWGKGGGRSGVAAQDGQSGFGGGGGGSSAGAAGNGGGGTVVIRFSAYAPGDGTVAKPASTNFTYTGETFTMVDAGPIGYAYMTNAVPADTANQFAIAATHAGNYSFRLKLLKENGFSWSDGDEEHESVDVEWSILKAPNSLEFSLDNWKSGAEAKTVSYECDFGTPVFDYAVRKDGVAAADASYSGVKPSAVGTYWIRGRIAGTDDYEGVDWIYKPFAILEAGRSPVAELGWFADLILSNYTGTATNDYPVLVKISEGSPAGFSYSQAAADGSDIRFTDDGGSLLPSAVYTNATYGGSQWRYGGTSWFVVNVPAVKKGTTITMSWGALAGSEGAIPTSDGDLWGTVPQTGTAVTSQFNGGGGSGLGVFGEATLDPAAKDGNLLVNRWTAQPALSSQAWDEGDAHATVTSTGATASGIEPALSFRYLGGGGETNEWPEISGWYEAVFTVAAGNGYQGIEATVEFEIKGGTVEFDSVATTSGRILLFNNDGAAGGVDFQAPANTATTGEAFWETLAAADAKPTGYPTVLAGSEFMLRKNGQSGCDRLWHLVDCRFGNNFPSRNADPLEENKNYLFWSDTSYRFNSTGKLRARRAEAGQCLMRNSTDAAVASSCFEEGIGTIYFDAVNENVVWGTTNAPNYSLVVEVATNCWTNFTATVTNGWDSIDTAVVTNIVEGSEIVPGTEGNDEPEYYTTYTTNIIYNYTTNWITETVEMRVNMPPTDENIFAEEIKGGTVSTNYYGHNIEWTALPVTPYLVSNGVARVCEATTNLVLDVAQYRKEITGSVTNTVAFGGATNSFYRVVVPVGWRVPARFRIRRTAVNEGNAAADGDYIILDNVIASLPPHRADLEPFGIYDEARDGKQALGWEGAWNVPYPSAADAGKLFARARPVYSTNTLAAVAYPNTMVTKAEMHYRWRYLTQTTNAWKTVVFNHRLDETCFTANTALEDIPAQEGDIEFYFTAELRAAHYKYYDFSGLDIGVPGYTENISVVTNRRTVACIETGRPEARTDEVVQTCGTDWYVRLRQGESAYEDVTVTAILTDTEELADATRAQTNIVALAVNGSHSWRGYMATPPLTNEFVKPYTTVHYRLAARNRQTAGAKEFATNTTYWIARDSVSVMPVSGTMTACGEDDWQKMPYSWATGHYLFQASDLDDALYLSVVQADYQNFNGWNDARTANRKFVGNAIIGDTNTAGVVSGASTKQQEYSQNFDRWTTMPESDSHWKESFTGNVNDQTMGMGATNFYAMGDWTSPEGWNLQKGMAVFGRYRDRATGVAFQMRGQGFGSVGFEDAANTPRGIQRFSFKARTATVPDFASIAYFAPPGYVNCFSNYTYHAKTALDLESGAGFDGNGSVSLIAYYTPGEGCYEFRMEQAYTNKVSNCLCGQVFSLRKWIYDSAGHMTNKVLRTVDNKNQMSAATKLDWATLWPTASNATHNTMFITAVTSNDVTYVMGGIYRQEDASKGKGLLATGAGLDGKYNILAYRDTATDRLSFGYPGVLIANCPGRAVQPAMHAGSVSPLVTTNAWKGLDLKFPSADYTYDITFPGYNSVKFTAPGVDLRQMVSNQTKPGTTNYVRSIYMPKGLLKLNAEPAIAGIAPSNTVEVLVRDAAGNNVSTNWVSIGTTNITSFKAGATISFTPYRTKDSMLKLAVVGTEDDPRVDVVVDDLELTQWRGDDWKNVGAYVGEGYSSENSGRSGHTNFVFTSSWIKGGDILMSAKRTDPEGSPCSIRSPLMDGYELADGTRRGEGLGMFSFSYKNAHTNTVVLLQIATNSVDYSNVATLDERGGMDLWTTVKEWDFSTMTPAQRSGGTLSHYIGEHGVHGAMRIALAQRTVEAAAASNDPNYGSITITETFCRDEPALGDTDWIGWNLRTFNITADSTASDPDRARMLLTDRAARPGNTGLSFALNNSVSADTYRVNDPTFKEHVPFLQSPVFSSNIVGEVSFRARKYDSSKTQTQPSLVSIYGSKTGSIGKEGSWQYLTSIPVSNEYYTTYTFRADQAGGDYKAFRFAVIGVAEAATNELAGLTTLDPAAMTNAAGRTIYNYTKPVRVLIDEVSVSQTMRAQVGFRDVGVFRNRLAPLNMLEKTEAVTEAFPGPLWQPMIGEEFGVQCEVYAQQLPEEVDFDRGVKVVFYWYYGEEPWGFENWKDSQYCHRAVLERATGDTGGKLIFRSSHELAPGGIVPDICAPGGRRPSPGAVVQYALEATWYPAEEGSSAMTSVLKAGDWTNPAWYAPVDKNAGKDAFAAYTLLDTVAPGWAWINEVNIFGGYNTGYKNNDADYQYVEVAVPSDTSLQGWKVLLLDVQPGSDTVVTNTLGVFGEGDLKATKTANMASNMTFRVLAGQLGKAGGRLPAAEGKLDGTWKRGTPSSIWQNAQGQIYEGRAFALQLVRASGVVEHEIVAMGYDFLAQYGGMPAAETPPAVAAWLNAHERGGRYGWVGNDWTGTDDGYATNGVNAAARAASLSVLTREADGIYTNNWSNTAKCTPGEINEGQQIDPDAIPRASGSSIMITAYVEGGHLEQSSISDPSEFTTEAQIYYVAKGSERGTNIVYRADRWWELGAATTNGAAAAARLLDADARTYVLEGVGLGASNSITVVASARPNAAVREAGVQPGYEDAVLDWLAKGRTLRGPFADPDSTEVKRARFLPWTKGADGAARWDELEELTLTQMYWLDIDPTMGGVVLRAGVTGYSPNTSGTPYSPHSSTTEANDTKLEIYANISNCTTDASSPWYGTNWTPYVIRSITPGETSLEAESRMAWRYGTNATFKINGIMDNTGGKDTVLPSDMSFWTGLRWFVFDENSFDENSKTTIYIADPLGTDTPGYAAGWRSWWLENSPDKRPPVYMRWALDTRGPGWYDIEVLQKTNTVRRASAGGGE